MREHLLCKQGVKGSNPFSSTTLFISKKPPDDESEGKSVAKKVVELKGFEPLTPCLSGGGRRRM